MRAKTGLVLQNLSLQAARDQVRDAYSAATEDFTADEQASLREMIDTLQPTRRIRAPLYARMHDQATLRDSARVFNLLIHEQTHVLQRHNPALFATLYTEAFGFRQVTLQPAPQWLRIRRVVNPDAPDADWVFPIGDDAPRH